MMNVIIANNAQEAAAAAANIIRENIENKPDTILGLATGSTPLLTYKKLIEYNKNNGLDFSKVKTFNLDEYCGLMPDHDQSYRYFMNTNLFNHININLNNTHVPSGISKDFDADCENYENSIEEAGGIDIQVLGIGPNGHIGFNEPDSSLFLKTHVTDLTEETIKANSRFFSNENDVPRKAVTMGIGTIMKSKKVILLITGANKAEIAKDFFESGIKTSNPATIVKLHPDTTVILDKDAASLLNK